ncbi:MAG: alanyl-tRNA editing protein [Alphaproteobacteria bacterium]|nr:alanyl-tRNA editing protein [Alphaproteobacteria bacterium]
MDFSFLAEQERALGPTIKLFNDDPYLTRAEATVLFVQGPYVIMDKTIFYAEAGGQASDTGTIGGLQIAEVQKKGGRRLVVHRPDVDVPAVTVDTVIVHQLAQDAPFAVGARVQMELDWQRRYAVMRYHSVSHFLYHAAHKVYDTPDDSLYTKGCSIDHEGARFDFFGSLGGENIPQVEALANELIARALPITREAEPLTQDIHYWRYDDILIPCGGTHVRSASELAPIKVKRAKKGSTTTRLSCVFVEEG